MRNIAAALARLDPANAADYRARAAAYTKEIQAVDQWARQEIAGVPAGKRRALASHDSLQYIANAYGITLLAVNGWTNNSEPSAAELAKLARTDPGRPGEGAVPRQHHRSAGHAAHRR